MDTDNLYFACGSKTLEDVARIKLREEFEAYKKQWLVCDKCFALCSGECRKGLGPPFVPFTTPRCEGKTVISFKNEM